MSESAQKKILVIEDEPSTLKSIVDELSSAGFSVSSATDGVTGLDAAFKEHPDVVLLDLMLPRQNGLELLKKLRADSWGKNASVIVLTALEANDKIMKSVIKDVPSFYLMKRNWNLFDLTQKVKECLHIHQAGASP